MKLSGLEFSREIWVEVLNLGHLSIQMIFKSMSHSLQLSHTGTVWFYSSHFPKRLPFCQHLCFEGKILILLLLTLNTQPQLKDKIQTLYRASQSGHNIFTLPDKILFIFTSQTQMSALSFNFPDNPGRVILFSPPRSRRTCMLFPALSNMVVTSYVYT